MARTGVSGVPVVGRPEEVAVRPYGTPKHLVGSIALLFRWMWGSGIRTFAVLLSLLDGR